MIGGRDSRREVAQLSGYDPEQEAVRANAQLAKAEEAERRRRNRGWLGRLMDRFRRR
jgi:hypothetical protein